MVYRVFVEKKQGFTHESDALYRQLTQLLQVKGLTSLRIVNRYDAENIDSALFDACIDTVFSEPQVDTARKELSVDTPFYFAVEYLPGQFDQRADSAEQCIQLISQKKRPVVKTAKVYLLYGNLTEADVEKIKKYCINPVECRLADMKLPETLSLDYEVPTKVEVIDGFCRLDEKGLTDFISDYGLAMDKDDIVFCQKYFAETEKRDPTLTEIRLIDTYWSDHCRHTTFLTTIDSVTFEDEEIQKAYERYLQARNQVKRTKPVNLMDLATIAVRKLKQDGKLDALDESDEINACTVKIRVNIKGEAQDWLLLFKNETHNHPTEIEPFGGAATCIGGAIRDPLSGRAYVYAAMRVTGAGNPLTPVSQTIKGKLPQRKIVTTAASGYSSYGNQIGLATGLVDEIYHEGYVAKRMEIGAVIGAVPSKNVVRVCPQAGDKIILLGGATGRDGCGGATGSSKSHNVSSLQNCGAEVQKGNAPEERKLQRLFRNPKASLLIKRCNDFGAGGVSVAIGELADGLKINLNAVPKKYEGLNGTELAISESQERMAVVVDKNDVDTFISLADSENLSASVVAEVQEQPRLQMFWNKNRIVDLSRDFLNSNGAEKHITAVVKKAEDYGKVIPCDFLNGLHDTVCDLNVCDKRGLAETFDSTIGANTILAPYGGKYQLTPSQAMAHTVAAEKDDTDTCSLMAYGYNPFIAEKSPYHSAYLAVIESVSKLIASGANLENTYLTFQEYFEKLGKSPEKWGKPLSALLGGLSAQLDLNVAAIGGKDSMSGSFENLHVPPTLVSFAVSTDKAENVISSEFKNAGSKVVWLRPQYEKNGLPNSLSFIQICNQVHELIRCGKVSAVRTLTYGGLAEAVFKSCIGNGFGFSFDDNLSLEQIFGYCYGSFILQTQCDVDGAVSVGKTTDKKEISYQSTVIPLLQLLDEYQSKLQPVYPTKTSLPQIKVEKITVADRPLAPCKTSIAQPKVLIPVFPGTNCEYDTAKAFEKAGAKSEIFVINNLTEKGISQSLTAFAKKLKESQILFIPGGFSGGDEPDGSGKFITAFMRNGAVSDAIAYLLNRNDGLIGGICNGFQALIKLGLLPFGKICNMTAEYPTLTYNDIARHQSRIVRVRVCTTNSPWLFDCQTDRVYNVAISHGEGKFAASQKQLEQLISNGQIATQYVDLQGNPTMDIDFNPNGSVMAIEGIISPDGKIFGKMGHTERAGKYLYKNVEGDYDMPIFTSAVKYFK